MSKREDHDKNAYTPHMTIKQDDESLLEQKSLSYRNPNHFVGRINELELVRKKVISLLNKQRESRCTVTFLGEKGVGKTWFLLHLHRTELPLFTKRQVESIYVSFESKHETNDQTDGEYSLLAKNRERESQGTESVLLDFMKALAHRWKAKTAEDATLQEQSYWLSLASDTISDKVLVLLLDSVSAASPTLLDLMENHWLKHLVRRPNVLVVMASRGEMHSWTSPELRLYIDRNYLEPFPRESREASEVSLADFLEKTAAYLTESQNGAAELPHREEIDEIYQASGGFPFSAYFLARFGLGRVGELVSILLSFVPDRERSQMRIFLEAICILNAWSPGIEDKRGFRDEDMQVMLGVHPEERQYTITEVREIRSALTKHHILRWDRDVGGYVIDAALRYPIAYCLARNEVVWGKLHCTAARMYQDRARKFAQHKGHYTMLANPHLNLCPETAKQPASAAKAHTS